MNYFDGLIEDAFTKDYQERVVFRPWGTFAPGRILESPKAERKIKDFLNLAFSILLVSLIAIYAVAGAFYCVAYFLVFCFFYILRLQSLVKDMPLDGAEHGVLTAYADASGKFRLTMLCFIEVLSAGLAIGSFWFLYEEQDRMIGYIAVGIFSLSTLIIGYMIFRTITAKTDAS